MDDPPLLAQEMTAAMTDVTLAQETPGRVRLLLGATTRTVVGVRTAAGKRATW